MPVYSVGPQWKTDLYNSAHGTLPAHDDSLIDSNLKEWRDFSTALNRSVKAGSVSTVDIVSTYALVYTAGGAYAGGVVAPNGDIHFIPFNANRGQKISAAGVVSTYSLAYTRTEAYYGGVLAPNGDIHFVPFTANRGQKINATGVVSTYALTYTTSSGAYVGGVLDQNGDIHMIPYESNVGQKISTLSAQPFDASIARSPFFNKL